MSEEWERGQCDQLALSLRNDKAYASKMENQYGVVNWKAAIWINSLALWRPK